MDFDGTRAPTTASLWRFARIWAVSRVIGFLHMMMIFTSMWLDGYFMSETFVVVTVFMVVHNIMLTGMCVLTHFTIDFTVWNTLEHIKAHSHVCYAALPICSLQYPLTPIFGCSWTHLFATRRGRSGIFDQKNINFQELENDRRTSPFTCRGPSTPQWLRTSTRLIMNINYMILLYIKKASQP